MKPITKSPYSSPTNNKPPPIFHLLLLLLLPHSDADSDPTALIYHHCTTSNQTPTSQSVSSLFKSLITHSTTSTFDRQTTTQTGVPISAEYQCRADMSSAACQACVTHLGILSNTLCAGARAERVQLRGCYVRYEADGGEEEEVENGVLHKECGEREGGYVDGARDAALWAVGEGIVRSGSGFCEATSEGVRAVAQCRRELFGCDCAECVSSAAEVVRAECAGALTGEVYLDGCYVSYASYSYPSGYKKNGSSGKLVAIVLGGGASLGLAFILFMFFKSCGKKDDD